MRLTTGGSLNIDTGGEATGDDFRVSADGSGRFFGSLQVDGTLSKGGGSFTIDHPLDPENRLLQHSFVESPDMMNIYNGNVVTDATGLARVELPDWFEALNRDYRYQLTVIGFGAEATNTEGFPQAIIGDKIEDGAFSIRSDRPFVEVSWQVTGIRQDAWAEAHRIEVEPFKSSEQRGRYLHPKALGKPEALGMLLGGDADAAASGDER